ncbi:MAG: lysophospholipid acyltransferase family protein [Castellaniella sp.]
MLLALFHVLARLPLPLLHATGRFLGRLVYRFPGRYRLRLDRNARQAGYFERRFARRASAETGAMILETPKVWLDHARCLDRVISDEEHVIERVRSQGRGILFLTPHLGCFEITARHIARRQPITVMYRPPRWAPLAPVMARARELPGLAAVPANRQGVREFVRALRRGEAVGLLPDQVPGGGEGLWTPFFGRPAYTMTLAARLALQTGVAVVLTAGERLPHGRGWRIHYQQLEEPLPTEVPELVAAINQAMETLIRRLPEQYLWSYSRYKRPEGAPERPESPPFP